MITGLQNIADVFNIFHDGTIEWHSFNEKTLVLKIGILYLAERIDPSYEYFEFRLHNAHLFKLKTWDDEPRIILGAESILAGEFEILSAEIVDDQISVTGIQNQKDLGYDGGNIFLTADSAEVLDQESKNCSLEGLVKLCDGYWDDWEKVAKEARGEK